MWTFLDPRSAKLEEVFKPLHDKAIEFGRLWSIAEIKITEDDISWLRSWFSHIASRSTDSWVGSEMPVKLYGDTSVSYGQMFGSLLVCAAAEVCRDESREDSVWPSIRSILPEAHPLIRELFLSNGQPSTLTKDIISDAVRCLNLRHVMDIEGTQQWFTTIKLQFGFTYRGAKNRLAEWLVNLGRPHAVQYLNGESDEFPELASKSFQSLWRVLTQFRRGLIKESEIRGTLELNPWIKLNWIDDLMMEAKAKIESLGVEDRCYETAEAYNKEVSDEQLCLISDIALEWPQGKPPRLVFHLDRQAIEEQVKGTELSELDFYIDGKKLCRWLRQRDGSWVGSTRIFAEQDINKQQPNLKPRTFIVQSGITEPLAEWDFADSGLTEEVLVFDLKKGNLVKAGAELLEPNRRYAIVCDRNCEIQGQDPEEVFINSKIARKVVRLVSPLDENLCLIFDDFVLWQPVKAKDDNQPNLPITLSTSTRRIISLNDRTRLLLTGLPEDAESVKLLIHTQTYELERNINGWTTTKDVTMTPELAAKQRRVRVRFSLKNRSFYQTPRLEFRVFGTAMCNYEQDNDAGNMSFTILKQGVFLNRAGEPVKLRIWTGQKDVGTMVLESNCLVGRLRHQKIALRDFPGHGGQLHFISEGKRHGLGIICIDKGCVNNFHPPMLGSDAQMFLLSDKDPKEATDEGYVLYKWFVDKNQKAKFGKIPNESILPKSRKRVWKIRDLCNPLAIALTWKGAWLGGWWNCELVCDYVNRRQDLPEHDFAIMKWLRVPILYSTLYPTIKKVILSVPCRFIKTWLSNYGLPQSIRPQEHIGGIDSVIRSFLWNDFPSSQAKDAIKLISQLDGSTEQENKNVNNLNRLSNISPILLWKGMEHHLKKCPQTAIPLIHSFTRRQVGLLSNADEQHLHNRMHGLIKKILKVTDLSEERLEEIIQNRINMLHERHWYLFEQDRIDLLKLGETYSGRDYLSARIGQYWLELSRK